MSLIGKELAERRCHYDDEGRLSIVAASKSKSVHACEAIQMIVIPPRSSHQQRGTVVVVVSFDNLVSWSERSFIAFMLRVFCRSWSLGTSEVKDGRIC